MPTERIRRLASADNLEFVRSLMTGLLARGELQLPVLPEAAARVVALAGSAEADAAALARVIAGDQSLAAHVMRVATSAVNQPRHRIESLQQAISWLGMATISEIAFTVAVQAKLLNVPGQRARVRAMWRQSVATALWSRAVAEAVGARGDACYLGGLLHEIGKPACVQAIVELARRAATPLTDAEFDALVAEFEARVGVQLAGAWRLPEGVQVVVRGWREWAGAEERRDACAIVNLAHHLAEHLIAGSEALAAEALSADAVCAHLGLGRAELEALCAQSEHVRAVLEGY